MMTSLCGKIDEIMKVFLTIYMHLGIYLCVITQSLGP